MTTTTEHLRGMEWVRATKAAIVFTSHETATICGRGRSHYGKCSCRACGAEIIGSELEHGTCGHCGGRS